MAYTEEQKKNIETALQKILASAGFSNSNQLSNFLSFIVKKTIDDKAHEIKGYTIGVDALGRPEDFDPQIDPSVRVMAGRLRQALENYNRDNNQAIKIELIKGSYVPKIEFTDQKLEAIINYEEVSTVKIATQKASKIRPWLLVVTTSIACLILFNFIHFFYVKNKEFTSTTLPEKQSISIENATLPSLTLYIDADSEKMPDWITAEKIHSTAVVVLSRFHEYRIFDYNMENEPLDLNKNASDYYLSMYFAKAYADQSLEAFLTLTRPKENQIIWSDKIIFPPSKGEQAKANLQQIAIRTSEIMSPYGIIHSDITSNKSSQPSLNCIRAIYSYFAKEDLQSYSNGLDCARRAALGKNPSSSMYSMLTFMYVEAYRKQITEVSENPLKDADMYAKTAITLDPGNARAFQALFAVEKTKGNTTEAIQAAKKAISLNPYDRDILGDYASYLISINRQEEAKPILENALSLTPVPPAWLSFYTYLHADVTGDYKTADKLAEEFNVEDSSLLALAIMLSAERKNNIGLAHSAAKTLALLEPGLASNPRAALMRRGFKKSFANEIATRLENVGLSTALNLN